MWIPFHILITKLYTFIIFHIFESCKIKGKFLAKVKGPFSLMQIFHDRNVIPISGL